MSSSDDFDRSFELFEQQQKTDNHEQQLKDTSFATNETSFDASFDSAGFEFSAEPSTLFPDDDIDGALLFPADPFQADRQVDVVHVALHEQISALYDDFSQEGSVTVTGSIHVIMATKQPVTLRLIDEAQQLQRVEQVDGSVCQMLRDDQGNRSLRVQLDQAKLFRQVHLADFVCVAALRPVPLLIKTKVGVINNFARVGFKIRANPHLENVLKDVVIILAVPPDVDGERCKLSRPGGSWEELKRTVSWKVDEIEPGKALEIQAQFPLLEETTKMSKTPRFPILVRCSYKPLYTGIEIEIDGPEKLKLTESGRVLHRKV